MNYNFYDWRTEEVPFITMYSVYYTPYTLYWVTIYYN